MFTKKKKTIILESKHSMLQNIKHLYKTIYIYFNDVLVVYKINDQ